ncbi:MAG: (5-formylfuran-3-yl)methyl phosphate synthase, partial [Thermogemmata sp.]
VAYADWGRAKAIPPLEVARFARRYRFAAFLLDTCVKDGKCLLDFLKPEAIAGLIEPLQNAGITVALGGGLRPEHVKALRGLRPDYFAVRASACAGSKRTALIDPHRVRKWKETLAAAFSPARS